MAADGATVQATRRQTSASASRRLPPVTDGRRPLSGPACTQRPAALSGTPWKVRTTGVPGAATRDETSPARRSWA